MNDVDVTESPIGRMIILAACLIASVVHAFPSCTVLVLQAMSL